MRAMVRGAHFLAVAAMSAVGAAPAAVDEGLLASYDLLRADCVNGTFPDGAGAGGPLVLMTGTRCLHGLGVAADGAAPRATAGAAALRDALGASAADGSDGLTVELWLRLDGVGASTEEQPIFSIGAPDAASDGQENMGLRITALREALLVDMIFRGQSPYDDEVIDTNWFSKQIPDLIGDVAGGNVSHVVFSIGQRIEVFVDGELYYDKNFMMDYTYDTFLASEAWADTFTTELFCCRRRASDDGAEVKKKRRKRAWCCARRRRSNADEELGAYSSPAEDEKEEPPEPPRATVLKPFATVLQPFAPEADWQLALAGGARVKVLQIHEDGWAEVRDATGTTGLVPACYLDLPPPPPVQ